MFWNNKDLKKEVADLNKALKELKKENKRLTSDPEKKEDIHEQDNKIWALSQVFNCHKDPATLKEKVEAAKEIYSFVYGEEQSGPEEDKLLPVAKIFLQTDTLLNREGSNEKTYAIAKYKCVTCDKNFYVNAGEYLDGYYCPSCGK